MKTLALILIIALSGCATPQPRPYIKADLSSRVNKIYDKAEKENWVYRQLFREIVEAIEQGLDKWAEDNLKRR